MHFGTRYYTATLPAMMAEWRRQFRDPDLPFLIVQLPGYGPVATQPTAATWADLREAQRQVARDDAHAALAVTIDIGNLSDLHPTNKREVGRRLSIAARHLIYGEKIPPSGPEVSSATRRGDDVVIAFHDVTGALTLRSQRPSGFELCGADQASCRWAEARVTASRSCSRMRAWPSRVRYAWGETPVASLYDASGLPAGPFEIAVPIPRR